MKFPQIIFSLFLFFVAGYAVAQKGATIKAAIDKNKILIGERLTLTITFSRPAEATTSFVNIDSIEHFEFLEKPVIDTTNTSNGTLIKGVYPLTSFDSGHWVIPSFVVGPGIQTDTIPVDIVFADFDPNKDYNDIKDIIEVKPAKKKQWWLYAAGAALLVAAALIYFLRKKKPLVPVAQPVVSLNAYEEAMKELQLLQGSKPETKLFHSKLTGIFRLYVYRKKGILSLQKTTDDLVLQLKDLNIGKEQFDKLAQALRLSDFVKFAKYIPSAEDDMSAFNTIRNSIINIEKSETSSPSLGGS